jgi:hypothetical protein
MGIGEKGSGYRTESGYKRRQDWSPGKKVNVGWNKDLEVVGEHPHGGVHLKRVIRIITLFLTRAA